MTNNEKSPLKIAHKMDPSGKHVAWKYKKTAKVLARPAIPGEVIETVLDGRLETRKEAGENEVVVKNPGGEVYIVPGPTFRSKYSLLEDNSSEDGWKTYEAKGEIWALPNTFGRPIEIQAPWGPMYGDENCWLVLNSEGDAYLLADDAKNETYAPVDDGETIRVRTMVL